MRMLGPLTGDAWVVDPFKLSARIPFSPHATATFATSTILSSSRTWACLPQHAPITTRASRPTPRLGRRTRQHRSHDSKKRTRLNSILRTLRLASRAFEPRAPRGPPCRPLCEAPLPFPSFAGWCLPSSCLIQRATRLTILKDWWGQHWTAAAAHHTWCPQPLHPGHPRLRVAGGGRAHLAPHPPLGPKPRTVVPVLAM